MSPTYKYECPDCKHAFQDFQQMSEKPYTECPECKKLNLKRLIGPGSIVIFNGQGFYSTDYKKEGYAPEKKE